MERILGTRVRAADGSLDRARAADAAFGDAARRRALEDYLHPIARRRIEEELGELREAARATGRPRLVVLDVPLLFEGGLAERCDRIVFVESQDNDREARAGAERGWEAGEVLRREGHQMGLQEKRDRSDHVIRNMGSVAELAEEAERVRAELFEPRRR
jgi:dephospho-CoA kinase